MSAIVVAVVWALTLGLGLGVGYWAGRWQRPEPVASPPPAAPSRLVRSKCGTTSRRELADPTRRVLARPARTRLGGD